MADNITQNNNQNRENLGHEGVNKKHSFFGGTINLQNKDFLDFRYNSQEEIDQLNQDIEMNELEDSQTVEIGNLTSISMDEAKNFHDQITNSQSLNAEINEGETVNVEEENEEEIKDVVDVVEPQVEGEENEKSDNEILENGDGVGDNKDVEDKDTDVFTDSAERDENINENIDNEENTNEERNEPHFIDPFSENYLDDVDLPEIDLKKEEKSEEIQEDENEIEEQNDNIDNINSGIFDPFENGVDFDNEEDENEEIENIETETAEEEQEDIVEEVNEELVEDLDEAINIDEEKQEADEEDKGEEYDEGFEETEGQIENDENLETEEDNEEQDDSKVEDESDIIIEDEIEDDSKVEDESDIIIEDEIEDDSNVEDNEDEIEDDMEDDSNVEDIEDEIEDDITEYEHNSEDIDESSEIVEESEEIHEEETDAVEDDNINDNDDVYVNVQNLDDLGKKQERIKELDDELGEVAEEEIEEEQEEEGLSAEELFENEPEFFADDELSQKLLELVRISREIFKLERKNGEKDPYFKIIGGKSEASLLEYLFYLIEEENEPLDLFIKKEIKIYETGEDVEHMVQFSYNGETKELDIYVDEMILYKGVNKSEKDSSELRDTNSIFEKFIFLSQNYYEDLKSERDRKQAEKEKKKQLQRVFRGF